MKALGSLASWVSKSVTRTSELGHVLCLCSFPARRNDTCDSVPITFYI